MLATLQLTYFDFVRELLMSSLAYTFTWIGIKTGAYVLWQNIAFNFRPEYIRSARNATIAEMKREARAAKRRRREEERRRWEKDIAEVRDSQSDGLV